VQFESASSFPQMAIKYFFDLDKPCFAPAWLQSHTTVPSQLGVIIPSGSVPTKSGITPQYYVVLCGFPRSCRTPGHQACTTSLACRPGLFGLGTHLFAKALRLASNKASGIPGAGRTIIGVFKGFSHSFGAAPIRVATSLYLVFA
jgi:hypothetical protein